MRAGKSALERIFFHLIENAIKFGHPQGHVWIEFEANGRRVAPSRSSTTCIGISQNQLRSIFDAFYQVDNQLTRSYEGLGIGLAVIKKQLGPDRRPHPRPKRPRPRLHLHGNLPPGRAGGGLRAKNSRIIFVTSRK